MYALMIMIASLGHGDAVQTELIVKSNTFPYTIVVDEQYEYTFDHSEHTVTYHYLPCSVYEHTIVARYKDQIITKNVVIRAGERHHVSFWFDVQSPKLEPLEKSCYGDYFILALIFSLFLFAVMNIFVIMMCMKQKRPRTPRMKTFGPGHNHC